MKNIFTSESVTEGHPDKICDQISDAVLDAILKEDPNARVACETTITKGLVLVTGEISSTSSVDLNKIVRDTIREIGYTNPEYGIDADSCAILISMNEQSPDIAQGVDSAYESREEGEDLLTGAGDQGMMFGYATNETPEMMPLPINLAHKLTRKLTEVRKEGILDYLRPDGKSQVSVEYDEGKPVRVDTVVISAQHDDDVDITTLRKDIKEKVIEPVLGEEWMDEDTKILINPTGRFVIGGPEGDAGLTGRKIIVDTYGGMGRHGGGCFSGKDPTKVDRSASYAARWVAKNIVASGLADKAEVQLAYAIGVAHPVSINVNTFGTGKIPDTDIAEAVSEVFDLRPQAIIKDLKLRETEYKPIAAYGHFGRDDQDIAWEETSKTEELRKYL